MEAYEIKRIRNDLGLTQKELSQKLGLSLRTIQKWEGGETKIRQGNIFMLKSLVSEKKKDMLDDISDGRIKALKVNFSPIDIIRYIQEEKDTLMEIDEFRLLIVNLSSYSGKREEILREIQQLRAKLDELGISSPDS